MEQILSILLALRGIILIWVKLSSNEVRVTCHNYTYFAEKETFNFPKKKNTFYFAYLSLL